MVGSNPLIGMIFYPLRQTLVDAISLLHPLGVYCTLINSPFCNYMGLVFKSRCEAGRWRVFVFTVLQCEV